MTLIVRLIGEQNHRCCYCGHSMMRHRTKYGQPMPRNTATKDHYEPKTYGGITSYENMIAACFQCNTLRGELDADAFYNLMQKWFKRDPNLRVRWHTLTREELYPLKINCLLVHEKQLRGRAQKYIEYAFRHFTFVTNNASHFGRAWLHWLGSFIFCTVSLRFVTTVHGPLPHPDPWA